MGPNRPPQSVAEGFRVADEARPGIAGTPEVAKHTPENRASAPSKLRRNLRHCPVCLATLAKNARRTRRRRSCVGCGACPQPGKRCVRCRAVTIWEGRGGAACRACGLHGVPQVVVVTGSLGPNAESDSVAG